MIGSTARQRLLQSAAHNLQRCGKRPLRCFIQSSTTPKGFHPQFQLSQERYFFSTTVANSSDLTNQNHNGSNHLHVSERNSSKPIRFEDFGLHPRTLKALRRQGIHKPTEVQQKTFDSIRKGTNVVARSRTGTGKTLAFLVPSLERYLAAQQQQQPQQDNDSPSNNTTAAKWGIPILVLAPTRELAAQIGKEAEKLLEAHHNRRLSSQVVYGGSSKKQDLERFRKGLPTILVATPGRLKDHLATTTQKRPHGVTDKSESLDNKNDRIPFSSALQNGNLQTLVLDETDRLLELGFRRDIQDILSCLNQQHNDDNNDTETSPTRQTLLFSATLAPDILDVVDLAIAPRIPKTDFPLDESTKSQTKNYEMIDCLHEEDLATHTNANTSQSYVVLSPERFWIGTMEFILQLMTTSNASAKENKKKKNKIIVFFEMTRLAQLYCKFLSLRLGHTSGVWELHGKMHQKERTIVTRRFRNAPHGVLLTSDVSARGVDYPDVTHVVQVGAPQNRETYIHRLGRTGRAGKEGSGILVLPQSEQDFLVDELEGLGLEEDTNLQQALLSKKGTKASRSVRREIENELGMLKHDLHSGRDHTGMEESLKLAYHSLVSYYFQTRRRRRVSRSQSRSGAPQSSSLQATVTMLNQLIQDFGLPELPAIGFQRAKNMGIDHLTGHLNIRKDWEDQNSNTNSEKHGDSDDWFGLNRDSLPPKQTSSPPRRKNKNRTNHSSNDFTKERSKKTKQAKRKKKESQFDDRQRYNHSGEFPSR